MQNGKAYKNIRKRKKIVEKRDLINIILIFRETEKEKKLKQWICKTKHKSENYISRAIEQYTGCTVDLEKKRQNVNPKDFSLQIPDLPNNDPGV